LDPRARRILRYIWAYKARLGVAAVTGLLMAGCMLLMGIMIKWFTAAADNSPILHWRVIKFGIEHGWFRPDQARIALVCMVSVFTVLIYIPKGVFAYINSYMIASVTNRVGTDVRSEMYAHLQTLPLSFFHHSRTGHIISRMSYDVALIQNSSNIVTQAIDAPVLIIAGVAGMFAVSWKLAVLTIIFVPMMVFGVGRLTSMIRGLTTTTQERLADVNAVIDESIRGVRIVKSFGMEDQEVKRFGRANAGSLRAALRAARRASAVLPAVEVMGGVAGALTILTGGWMVVVGEIVLGDLNQFIYLAFIVAGAGKQFGRLKVIYEQTMAGAERIFDLLDTKSDMIEKPDAVVLTEVRGLIEFRSVGFEYNPGEPVLEDVSLVINPGEVVAIVGPSGAGKSTVADLIPRFYDVTSGQVMVEGMDVRDLSIASLRKHIAMVPQDTILFSGTISDNISYGRPGASMDEITEAARSANADAFIRELPDGYDTMLGEGGVGLSGGQRQRIAIARALLKDPRILILDEATSSLDTASEGVVQEALERLMRGRSTLVIAHRLSTVTGADRILVLDRGRVVESGSFSELVSSPGLFAQLYRTQFRAGEAV